MKYILLSFLFFCWNNNGLAANYFKNIQEVDSLAYYYKLGSDPLQSTSLSRYRFFVRKKDESSKAKDTLNTIYFLRHIAIIQNNLGDYYGSETSAVEALILLDHLKTNEITIETRVALYNLLGRIHKALFNYPLAIDYYNKALALSVDQKNTNIIQNNKFVIYKATEQFQQGEKEFTSIYNQSLKQDDAEQTHRALDNLAFMQSKLNRPEAFSNLHSALKGRLKTNDLNGTYSSYKHLSIYYSDRAQKDSALYYAQKALETAQDIHNGAYINDGLSILMDLSDDPIVAKYKHINDSITKSKQIEENKYALVKYNYTQQEQLAKQNELEKEKEKRLKLIYMGIGILGALISISVYFVLRTKHKKDKLQQVYTTESRISKKIHDEVANEVYHVITKIQRANHKEEVLDDLENIYNKTRDISKENSALNVKDNFTELVNDLLLSYKTEKVNIITKNLSIVDWSVVQDLKKAALYRVLQELLTNMRKHSEATWVVISFSQTNKKVVIDYKDNGMGCVLKKANGLTNAENRIQSINGTIIFESEVNKGFNVIITI